MTSAIEAEFDTVLAADPTRTARALREFEPRMVEARLVSAGQPLPVSLKPHFVDAPRVERWALDAVALVALINRVAPYVLAEPDLYARLGLPAAAHDLIAIEPGYADMAIVCRPDCVYDGAEMRVLEINADCPGGAAWTDQLQRFATSLLSTTDFDRRWQIDPPARAHGLHAALISAYREQGGAEPTPRIAVVGWAGDKNDGDRELAAIDFVGLGSPAALIDPRELSYRDGRLHARGERIDIVNRRVQLHEFWERPDDLAVLTRAYRDGAVCMVTPLRAEVATTKTLLALLQSADVRPHLTAPERALVDTVLPPTCVVTAHTRAEVLTDHATWVLKPGNGYAGAGITFGSELTAADWQARVDHILAAGETWVAQRRAPTSTYEVVTVANGALAARTLNVTWGPWIQGGRFCGVTSRAAGGLLVNVAGGGALMSGVTYRHV